MINQGQVKTVVMGGRPNNQPMAVIGGVQGNQVLEVPAFQVEVQAAIDYQADSTGNSSKEADLTRKTLGALAATPPLLPDAGSKVSVNFLDGIAANDTTATPLQFSGGIAADCRTYYMHDDLFNLAYTWSRIAKGVKAGGKGLCVNGTMTDRSQVVTLTNGTIGSAPLSTGVPGSNNSVGSAIIKPFTAGASTIGSSNVGWSLCFIGIGALAMSLF